MNCEETGVKQSTQSAATPRGRRCAGVWSLSAIALALAVWAWPAAHVHAQSSDDSLSDDVHAAEESLPGGSAADGAAFFHGPVIEIAEPTWDTQPAGGAEFAGSTESDPCGFEFQEGFGYPGVIEVNSGAPQPGVVRDFAVFNDGSGPRTYFASNAVLTSFGSFGGAVGIVEQDQLRPLDIIARRSNTGAHALATFDDGGGERLYVGGTGVSSSRISPTTVTLVRWDGEEWSTEFALSNPRFQGEGITNTPIFELEVLDIGSGPSLYVGGGRFGNGFVDRYTSDGWSSLDSTNGISLDLVISIAAFDDGTGPTEYVGGSFRSPDGSLHGVARWDGSTWNLVGHGIQGNIWALAEFDDGTGPMLYAGGTEGLFRLEDETWTEIPFLPEQTTSPPFIADFELVDGASGPTLLAAGQFEWTESESEYRSLLARWNGVRWITVHPHEDPGFDQRAFAVSLSIEQSGPGVLLGGEFRTLGHQSIILTGPAQGFFCGSFQLGGLNVAGIARLEDGNWRTIGQGLQTGLLFGCGLSQRANISTILDLHVHDDSSGEALYVSGDMALNGGLADGVIRRRDFEWERVGRPLNALIRDMSSTGKPGSSLFASGLFAPDDVSASQREMVVRWDGSNWTILGEGLFDSFISALEAVQIGEQELLFVGGGFNSVDGLPVGALAMWDGTSWSDLDGGVDNQIGALLADPEGQLGTKNALYAGGRFNSAGLVDAHSVAMWDGLRWRALGEGLAGTVLALAVFDDGIRPCLYAGGVFTTPGTGAPNLARWNGESWSPLADPGSLRSPTSRVFALLSIQHAGSSFLAVGGRSSELRTGPAALLWSGAEWFPFGSDRAFESTNISCSTCGINAMEVFDEGDGVAVWLGGSLFSADEDGPLATPFTKSSSSIAKWVQRGLPRVESQPMTTSFTPGQPAIFSVGAVDPDYDEQLFYQWRRDGVPLTNADRPIVQGATSPTLTIFPVRPRDEGEYSCVISNSCGETTTRAARLEFTTPPKCAGDADRSGAVDFQDITTILTRWGSGRGAPSHRVWAVVGDATGDGVVDFRDITSVLASFGKACE